jgi:serine/threonine-protein kinase
VVPSFPAAHTPEEAYFQHVLSRMLAKRVEDRPADTCGPTRQFLAVENVSRPMRARVPCVPTGHDAYVLAGVAVTLKAGDIAACEVDAIVSSANDELKMRSGTGEALRLRGGDAIEEEAMKGGRQPLGACVATGAGALAARHVFHAVSAWNEASCIGRAMCRALLLADELGHRSIALPALGTGVANVNIETCARAMTASLAWHLALGGSRLKRVEIVLKDDAKLAVFREVFEDVLRDDIDEPAADLGIPVEDAPVRADAATFIDTRHTR